MLRSFGWTVWQSPSSENLDPYPATTRRTPPNNTYTLNYEEPHMYVDDSKGDILMRINLYDVLCFCRNVYTLVLRHE